jgi:hypothetical protein
MERRLKLRHVHQSRIRAPFVDRVTIRRKLPPHGFGPRLLSPDVRVGNKEALIAGRFGSRTQQDDCVLWDTAVKKCDSIPP